MCTLIGCSPRYFPLKDCSFATSKGRHFLQNHMRRAVHKLTVQPVFSPRSPLVLVLKLTGAALQQGVIHIAFGRRDNQFELLISAVVAVLAGMVIVNVVVEVLSAPKSMTAMDLLPCVAL
jgi:hypothetical protein